jgi:hypothetical protein
MFFRKPSPSPRGVPLVQTTAISAAHTTWDDTVVILRGEDLTLVSIERQVLPSAPRLPRVWYRPARHERENFSDENWKEWRSSLRS